MAYDLAATTDYIRRAAAARGIDPDTAVRVARSEGLARGTWQSNLSKGGRREPSYGPFQLLVGGNGTAYPAGMGNDFIRDTGLDPSDPSNVEATVDYALDRAARDGWGAWYGAAKVGVGKRDGIGGNPTGERPTPTIADGEGQAMAYGGAGNDRLGTNYGGLGGLGGMPVEAAPEADPGFLRGSGMRNIFAALSKTLTSAPSDAPLMGFGENLAEQDVLSMKRQAIEKEYADKASALRARKLALMSQGFTADQAEQLANDSTASTLAVEGQNARRKLELAQGVLDRDARFMGGLTSLANGGDDIGGVEPAGAAPTASPYGASPSASPSASPAPDGRDTAGLTRTIKDADDVIASTGADVRPEPTTSFGTGHTTVDVLMGKRSQLVRALAAAPSDDAFQRGKLLVEDLDKRIEAYTPTATVKDYLWDMRQRQDAGEPTIRLGEWKLEQSRAGAQSITVGGEKTYNQTVSKGYGERFLEIQKAGQDAASGLGALNIMEQAMGDRNFYSGFGADQLMQARRAAAALGADPEGVSNMETFAAQTKGAALAAMGGSLGAGFSNADRSFVEGQVPSIENTPEGNRKLIDINRKLAQRKQQIAKFARDYAKKNDGQIDMDFDDALAVWAEQNPLFPAQPTPATGSGSGGGYVVRSVR